MRSNTTKRKLLTNKFFILLPLCCYPEMSRIFTYYHTPSHIDHITYTISHIHTLQHIPSHIYIPYSIYPLTYTYHTAYTLSHIHTLQHIPAHIDHIIYTHYTLFSFIHIYPPFSYIQK